MRSSRLKSTHDRIVDDERKISLAIKSIKEKKIPNLHVASKVFNIPYSKLRRRSNGTQFRGETRANGHLFTELEEDQLREWIASRELRGAAPTISDVKDMANNLLAERGSKHFIGINWASRFVKRCADLKSRPFKSLDSKRGLCASPSAIREWFDRLRDVILKYGICVEDIYNFDKTCFSMGLIASSTVVTDHDSRSPNNRGPRVQPGNREWVTVIECTNASGFALPPMIVYMENHIQDCWETDLAGDWFSKTSTNARTTDQIGIEWLRDHFIPLTCKNVKGTHRLLILDNHRSHATPEFDSLCKDNNIIPFSLPAHASHVLQPLDVGCLSGLKRAYRENIVSNISDGIHSIEKTDFLNAYRTARIKAFHATTIKESFASTGIHPLDPERVIKRLDVHLRTPSPPKRKNTEPWSPRTPSNKNELDLQLRFIEERSKDDSQSQDRTVKSAWNQVVKGFYISLQKNATLDKEIDELRKIIKQLHEE